MFNFLRKIAQLSSTAPNAAASVTSAVTPDVTPAVTPAATTVTADASPKIAPSLIISNWTELKPFPAREQLPGRPIQVWPVDAMPVKYPTASQIAEELFLALQRRCAGYWVLAMCIEGVIYPAVCKELGWPMRPWMGKDGVAAHLAKRLPPPKYLRTEIKGDKVRKLQHYWIPHSQTDTIEHIADRRRTA